MENAAGTFGRVYLWRDTDKISSLQISNANPKIWKFKAL